MKRSLAIWLALFLSAALYCQTHEMDSLLRLLDTSIAQKAQYAQKRQMEINALQRKLLLTHTDKDQFNLYRDLFGKYRSYRLDSALWAARQTVQLAGAMNDSLSVYSARLDMAEVLIDVGMYKEGLEILGSVNSRKLDIMNLSHYYTHYHHVYTLLADYAFSNDLKEQYRRLAYQYKDSILVLKRPGSMGYMMMKSEKLLYEEKFNEALAILDSCYQVHVAKGFSVAIPSICLANAYEQMGNEEAHKKYLAISAIADIQASTKEYISLWKLADLLFKEGDITRAYTYIECSMQDATFCNARYRTQEISSMLPLINQAYENKLQQEKSHLLTSVVLIALLLVILLIAIVYIYIQMKRLKVARQVMNKLNEELKCINNDLQGLNAQLQESNQVKEEYIGYVFTMCSLYIDKQDNLRKQLARKIKAGQIDDLYKTVNSSTFVANELNEFFYTFDSIFLKLYPRFIEEFNTLLQENERIYPKEGELMTPELRIFALIRLGIADSGKIASFLHYSAQTVYNYRLKVKNKSLLSKEEFREAIQRIG